MKDISITDAELMGKIPVYICSESGVLRWSEKTSYKITIGDEAGTLRATGYMSFKYLGKRYLNHRVIFFLVNGYAPSTIDHIDGDPTNNHINNLRGCTQSQNCMNHKVRKDSRTGLSGVIYVKSRRVWYAYISANKKRHSLGTYQNLLDAACARISAENRIFGEFSRFSSASKVEVAA